MNVAVRSLGREAKAVDAREVLAIHRRDACAHDLPPGELVELHETDRGLHVVHRILEAGFDDLVAPARALVALPRVAAHALEAERARSPRELVTRGREHPAFDGGE